MTEDSEPDESNVSREELHENELVKTVQQAVDDWVADESISAYREGKYIVTEEEKLVERISAMVAIAMREAAE